MTNLTYILFEIVYLEEISDFSRFFAFCSISRGYYKNYNSNTKERKKK